MFQRILDMVINKNDDMSLYSGACLATERKLQLKWTYLCLPKYASKFSIDLQRKEERRRRRRRTTCSVAQNKTVTRQPCVGRRTQVVK